MKWFRGNKFLLLVALSLFISNGFTTNAYCNVVYEKNSKLQVTDENYSEAFKQYSHDLEAGDISKYNGIMPYPYDINVEKSGGLDEFEEKYDPRLLGYMTPVKNQGINEVCWAFAGMGSLESYLKLKGYGEYDLSEEHIRWFATLKDGYGWNRDPSGGGPTQIVPGYLISSNGPKLEKDIPYSYFNNERPLNMDTAKRAIDVSDIEYIADDINSVKKAVKENGAVETCYYDNSNYLYGNSYYYNDSSIESVNHAVIIVGWDDNYSASNFKVGNQPAHNGAWLIKNSWGSNKYDGGYMWISYEDAVILKGKNGNLNYSIKEAKPASNEDIKKYQLDENGCITKCGFNIDGNKLGEVCYINVFDFDENYNKLDSVMFDSESVGASYKIYYDLVDQNGIPISDESKMQLLASGTIDFAGYRTVKIDNGYTLNKGKGAIVVKVTDNENSEGVSLGCEGQVVYINADNQVAYIPKADKGESFVMVKNKDESITLEDMNGDYMKSLSKYSPKNFCIKVNTKKVHDYMSLDQIDDYSKYVEGMNKITDKDSDKYKDMLYMLSDKYNKLSNEDKAKLSQNTRSMIEEITKPKASSTPIIPTDTVTDSQKSNSYDNNSLYSTIALIIMSIFTIYSFNKKKNMI